MAYPFGGHPTFAQYLGWAKGQGCEIKQGIIIDDDGRPYDLTLITSPSGRHYIDTVTQHNDRLLPTTIARLDRRLGLKSPRFSVDIEDDD